MRFIASIVLAASLIAPPYPDPAFALRGQELLERDPTAKAGVEQALQGEQARKLVEAALDRIRHSDPSARKLLEGVSISPAPGKGVRVEGDKIFIGVAPGREAKVLAQLLIWAGAGHRAVQSIGAEAERISQSNAPKSQQLRAIHDLLQKTPIVLHTGETTTLYEGKVYLKVGSPSSVKEMVRELVRAGNTLSKGGHPKEQGVLLGKSADDIAFDLLQEGDSGSDAALKEAWEEGEAAAKADERKQVHEPQIDPALLAGVKRYVSAHPEGLTGAWRAYADELNKRVRLNDRDRQSQFMEQLFNVYGFVHYGERSAGADGRVSEGAAALNSASEAAELLARALVDYLNDPFLGQRGDRAQQELLAEIAHGIHVENLLSYLRFGHIPMFLSAKIAKPMVSPQIANERMTQGPGGESASPMALTLQGTVHGLLTAAPVHQLLAISGPSPAAAQTDEVSQNRLKDYFPELPAEAGYRVGATGLIEAWQEAVADAGSLDEAARRIPEGLERNLDLALSRPNERTPGGTDELSELLLFYFSLGSSAALQKTWRPFLKEVDLKALSKEQGRSEEELVAGLFVWQALRAYLQKKKDDQAQGAVLGSLAALGKSRDGIFRFIADFYRRFEEADRTRRGVAEAAAQERAAQVKAGKAAAKKRKGEKVAQEFADLGIPLAPAGTPFSGGGAADARLLNAATLEGFIYRIHQLDLGPEQVQMLNADKGAAEGVMTTLIGGHGEGAKALKKAWRNLVQSLHPDRIGVSPPKYLEGQVGDKTAAAFLYDFLIPFDAFPEGRWWAKDKIGAALKQVKEALPDFAAARAEQEAARANALEERMRKLEQAMAEMTAANRQLLRRVEELEKRAGIPPPANAGMEAALYSAGEFTRRHSRQIGSLDLEWDLVEEVLELRGGSRSLEPPIWTVRLYFMGEESVGRALRSRVEASPVPGLRFVIEPFPEQGVMEGPALVLRQGSFGRDAPSGVAVVNFPEAAAEAAAAISELDPAILAAAAFEPLWVAVIHLRVQVRRFQDEEGEWVLAFFL